MVNDESNPSWAITEFGGAELSDARRTERLVIPAESLSRRPGASMASPFDPLLVA